jgi:hypothetical protein
VIEDTLRRIEKSLEDPSLPPARRRELTRLLADLRAELAGLAATRGDDACNIAALTAAAHEAHLGRADAAGRESATKKLTESVREFETTHPTLTSLVERIAETLSAAGI